MTAPLAIVLSGGGAKGAFQVGVLEELIVRRGVNAGIFCGVSTGAIQALGGAQDDIPGLKDVWLSLRKNSDVYTRRPLGVFGGLFGADSLYNASPIRQRIIAYANEQRLRATGKKLMCGVVNLGTGEFRTIQEDTPRIGDWVYASSAMPFHFSPMVDSAGGQWVDGGVRNVTPLDAAMEQGPRGVLVIMASPLKKTPQPPKSYNDLLSIALRSVSILSSEVFDNDIANAKLINDILAAREEQARRLRAAGVSDSTFHSAMQPIDRVTGEYRFAPVHLIAPDEEVAETLEFDPATIRRGIEKGHQAVDRIWDQIKTLVT